MKKWSLILVAFLFLVNACGPSVEGESKAWEENLKAMEKAKTDYPAFASEIDAKVTQAKALWDAAAGISNEEEKAKKMAEANNLLGAGCLGNLVDMNDKIKEVEDAIDKVESARKGKEGEDRTYAEDALLDANNAITAAKESFNNGRCADVERAFTKLGTVVTDLNTAVTKITASETQAKDSANANAKKEVKFVKCEYCNTQNADTLSDCRKCGAPLKK
jgi:hypothetical protein